MTRRQDAVSGAMFPSLRKTRNDYVAGRVKQNTKRDGFLSLSHLFSA